MCDALRNLVPFVQFKKREKHPWRSVTFSKAAGKRLQTFPLKHSKSFNKLLICHTCDGTLEYSHLFPMHPSSTP